MRAALSVVFGLAVMFALTLTAQAADKEVTLKGKVTCAKCHYDLAKAAGVDEKPASCQLVLLVKKGSKTTAYMFDEASHKKYHGTYCKVVKNATVTGTVSKEGGKNVIHVTNIENQ